MHRRTFLKSTAAGALVPLLPLSAAAQTSPSFQSKLDAFRGRIKPITKEERGSRIAHAQQLMKDQNIDVMFFEGGSSLSYFTGARWGRSERLFAMMLGQTGDPEFIAPRFEDMRAREQVGAFKLYLWRENESPYIALKNFLKGHNASTGVLGIEETTRFFIVDGIKKACPSVDLVSGTPVTAGCRSVKSDHEIELIQIGNDITKEVYQTAVTRLKDGMSEKEFAGIISQLYSDYGVNGGALVLFGEASASAHGLEKPQILKENQIVLMDGGCTVEGYESDVTRTICFGTPTADMQKVFDIVLKAQNAALAAAKPGVPADVIDYAARKVISDAGYGPGFRFFTHRLGHGIGMDGHEWYYLVSGNKRAVVARNMFSNEPGIYQLGKFGIRIEDEMLITENGAKILLPRAQSLDTMFAA